MTRSGLVPAAAIDLLECQTMADLRDGFRHAREQSWYSEATPADRAALDVAIANVEAHALVMFDSLRVRTLVVSVH